MNHIICPHCGSMETVCETLIGIKFSLDNGCVDLLSEASDIIDKIHSNIDNKKSINAECDTCGYEFVINEESIS